MGFADQIGSFQQKTLQKISDARDGIDAEVFRSIVAGSEITASPGQPVAKGKLKASWTQEKDGLDTVTSSDAPYARAVEENWGNVQYKNGGPHSVNLTVAGFGAIVQTVASRVSR